MTTAPSNVRRPSVFGTGLIALDLVVSADPAIPVRSWAGGTCGNVLTILAFLGWSAYPIARMNGNAASRRVKADLKKWGVHLDFAACGPTTHTPIIVQVIRRDREGAPTHRFSWSCLRCGQWLPRFKPVTAKSVEVVLHNMKGAAVFFMDRPSRASLMMASQAAAEGALVVFEPTGRSNVKLFEEALKIAHIFKYANERPREFIDTLEVGSDLLLEIQTLGSRGLRFRHKPGRRASKWESQPAITAPQLVDACGAGDWCTAGLLESIGRNGREGLANAKLGTVREAFRYGQALAAWNCGFEGARGGMYAVTREIFERQIDGLLSGCSDPLPTTQAPRLQRTDSTVVCPACPAE